MSRIPVVMCSWQKPERLPITIDMLEKSTIDVEFYVWNNNPAISDKIDEYLNDSNLTTHVHHSDKNVAGMGRFYFCKDIRPDRVVFIDDDQEFSPTFLEELSYDYRPRTIISQYAHGFNGNDYWDDRVGLERGQEAVYCGTGGMIADGNIFYCDKLYNFPRPDYYTMEDLWMSFVAKKVVGFNLLKGPDGIKEISGGNTSHRNFKEEKRKLFGELREGKYLGG